MVSAPPPEGGVPWEEPEGGVPPEGMSGGVPWEEPEGGVPPEGMSGGVPWEEPEGGVPPGCAAVSAAMAVVPAADRHTSAASTPAADFFQKLNFIFPRLPVFFFGFWKKYIPET
jgi:hypothetical protein